MPTPAILRRLSDKTSSLENRERGTILTTPVRWKDDQGAWIGYNNEVWLYRELPLTPLQWEDPAARLDFQSMLYHLLVALGATSVDRLGGQARFSDNREIHILGVTWEEPAAVPKGTPAELAEYLASVLTFTVPRRALVLGVKLRADTPVGALAKGASADNFRAALKTVVTNALGEDVPDLARYEIDRKRVTTIFDSFRATLPSRTTEAQMEYWYNAGKRGEVEMQIAKDVIYTGNTLDRIEMAVVQRFGQEILQSPHNPFLGDAFTHPEGVSVVSIRGELEPSTVTRNRARGSQRKLRAQMEEEMKTGDIDRPEHSATYQLAGELERFLIGNREPIITKCSIVFGRRVGQGDQTYMDELQANYGIEVSPLIHRQHEALDETLPCSNMRVNPFLQDVSVGMLAYAGLQGFSTLGDPRGCHIGLVDPDYIPAYLDPEAAPRLNKPVGCGIFGDLGSGKTFLMQSIATQAVLAGKTVIFLNPKGYDSRKPFADLVGGSTVKTSALEREPGFFDPFRFAEPQMAAEIATNFILSVLVEFSAEQAMQLAQGLKRGALAGARCVAEALEYVGQDQIKNLVLGTAEGWSTFGLGIARSPKPPIPHTGGLVLIEVTRKLPHPKGDDPTKFSPEERISLAVVRLISRASLELLAASGGGLFCMDEAWTLLASEDGRAVINELVREGRSRRILPVFATQRPSDLLSEGFDLEGFISRVFAMQLTDPKEAAAALRICGLQATKERLDWLRQAGVQQGEDAEGNRVLLRPAMALHRDLYGRHAAILIGPIPPVAQDAWTTNPEELDAQEAARQRAEARPAPPDTPAPTPVVSVVQSGQFQPPAAGPGS